MLFIIISWIWLIMPIVIKATTKCSSLNGPFCPFINGKQVPQNLLDLPVTDIFDDPPQFEKMISELLQQIQSKSNIVSNKKSGNSVIIESGSFELKGFHILKENLLYLLPTKWVRKPGQNWITIGLFGGHATYIAFTKDHQRIPIMILSIMDEKTKLKVGTCSSMLLRRISRGLRRNNVYEGVWKGSYSCLGSRTQAKLILVANKRKIFGKLVFRAENFPSRDTTLSGCKCLQEWHFDGAVFKHGECGRPPTDAERPWCFIEEGTCTKVPSGLNWDYCERARADPPAEEVGDKRMKLGNSPFYFNHDGELIQVQVINENEQEPQNNDEPINAEAQQDLME